VPLLQVGQACLTEEAEAMVTALQGLKKRLQQRDAAAAELHVHVPHLLAKGHISSEAQDVIMGSLCNPGQQQDALSKLTSGPLLASGRTLVAAASGNLLACGTEKQTDGQVLEACRASIHSHPLLMASMAGSFPNDRRQQVATSARLDLESTPALR
jgi:hypothetical protein